MLAPPVPGQAGLQSSGGSFAEYELNAGGVDARVSQQFLDGEDVNP